ncbi:hypothetical protein N7476_003016 [Penicillium atrosanguineum]|uniref:AAA+ ATPase domain-containing protein n=1 Tax=Penicillium atrosanguineum TaxID=1132637 RepID=A0A9W9Q4G5_9EURO|nr:hypothetical protein N7476_003016 [Penicillium atrosanguineum]
MAQQFIETAVQSTSNNAEVNGKETEKNEVKYAPKGSLCGIHKLYQTKPDENGRTSWSKTPPKIEEAAENDESAQYALISRYTKCYDGRRPLQLHSVVIQSEPLKKFLGNVLDKYPGVTTTLERLEFSKPFKPLVHRWEALVKARDEEQDQTTKEHINLFHKILEEELRDIIDRKKDLVRNGVITHDLIWSIFEPDDMVIGSITGRTRGYLFTGAALDCQTGAWEIRAKYIDFDGSKLGWDDQDFAIGAFTGTVPIVALPVSPLKYHANQTIIRQALIAQGKTWEEHKGYHFKQYDGVTVGFDSDAEPRKYQVKSRIIIDAEAFQTFHPHKGISLSGKISDELHDDQRMVTSNMVYGYALKNKEWLTFFLDCTSEIVWDSQAFDSLVLPKEHENLKDLILAFAKAQSKKLDDFDDVVQGKGRGVIMQLSGPPGVGKTLTAESVAEVMKVPLYVMSAGDLGTSASSVEESLKDILRMIPKWGAVLLLDEADVFMEARSATDLQRNELVSIFLRMLEYYEGILFLTTNRAENIDPAFDSRIHVSLVYQNLDEYSRRHVWAQFLGRTANTEKFSDEELDELAQAELNGRQIKNMLKTAGLLAWSRETTLKFEHVKVVLGLRQSNLLNSV